MSSALLFERTAAHPGAGNFAAPAPTQSPAAGNWCLVPRCTIKIDRCEGGFKLQCACDDDLSCATLQNLCKMLAGGLCSCCCTLNGITVCQCNLTCGICHCENTKKGVSVTCKCSDEACCAIIQACGDCLASCAKAGCCCYVSFNGTPVCCGTC